MDESCVQYSNLPSTRLKSGRGNGKCGRTRNLKSKRTYMYRLGRRNSPLRFLCNVHQTWTRYILDSQYKATKRNTTLYHNVAFTPPCRNRLIGASSKSAQALPLQMVPTCSNPTSAVPPGAPWSCLAGKQPRPLPLSRSRRVVSMVLQAAAASVCSQPARRFPNQFHSSKV